MKRIVLFGLLLPLLSFGQILVDVPLSDGVLPATWQNVDVDGFAADVFYTDQGIWAGLSAWEEVNFSSYGRAFYSTSNFETATGNANDWMITDAISITQETRLDFELVSSQFNGPESHSVYIANMIAGAAPQPSDFVAPEQNFTTIPGQWSSNEVDLSAYIGSTIYVAFVNDNSSSGNIQGIRNIVIRELLSNDVSIEVFNSNAVNQRTPLNSTTRYSVLDYSKTTAYQPLLTLRNQGLNALDSVVITMNIDDDVTGYTISETYQLSQALPAGDTTTIALSAIGLDTLFPALQSNQELDVEIFTDSSNGNGLSLAEDTAFSFMINPRQYFSPPYTTSFEYVLGGSSFSWEWNEWGWKSFDENNDNDAILVDEQTNYTAADGAYMLFSGVRYSGAVTDGDIGDYVETPEMQFDAGDYVLSMLGAAITGNGSTLDVDLVRPNGSSLSLGQISTGGGTTHQAVSLAFNISTTDSGYVLRFTERNGERGSWDLLSIEELTPPVAGGNLAATDETNPYVEYCDKNIILTNTSVATGGSTTVDWGDGSAVQSMASGASLQHSYSSNGNYTITVTATNPAGSDQFTIDLEVTDPPVLNADFIVINQGNGNVNITLEETFPCGGVQTNVDWGDGTVNSSTSHVYSANGTYTITLTAQTAIDIDQSNNSVTISGLATSIDNDLSSGFRVGPNPVQDKLRISWETPIDHITILDAQGRVMKDWMSSGNTSSVVFNCKDWQAGSYIIQIQEGQNMGAIPILVE
ncbi:MAG TPA: hypothetical protein DCF84_01950 [Bacteroidetes bacterium]|nr:hypothetical protein [Bacteroidota bacterium]